MRIGIEKTCITRAPSARAGRGLPLASRGIASRTTTWRGAQARGCSSATQSRALVEIETRRPRTRPPGRPTPGRVRRPPRHRSTSGCSRSRAATAGAGTLTPPLITMSSIRPSTVSRPSSSRRPASEVRNQPSTSAPAVSSGSPSYPSKSVGPPIRIRPSVPIATPPRPAACRRRRSRRRSRAEPYVATTRSPSSVRPARGARVDRTAAEQDGVRGAQRGDVRGVVEEPVQLGRHQRGEPRVAARSGHSVDRLVPGHQRPADHLHARRRTTAAGRAPTARPRRAGARWRRPRPAPRPATAAPAWARRSTRRSRRPGARRPAVEPARGGRRPRRSPTPRASPSSPAER